MLTVLANVICANDTADKIKEDEVKNLITDKYNAYILGSISYDLLYFYDAFSKTENTWIRGCADEIKKCGIYFFDIAKKYIAKAEKKDKDVLYAYILGCSLNYLMKYRTQPYIAYLTDGINDRVALNKKFVCLDSCYCNLCGKEPVDICGFTDLGENELNIIEGLYRYVISELKNQLIPDGLIKDCADKLTKALSQKKGILPHPGKEFVYKSMADTDNILNEMHLTWSEPSNDKEKNNFSYSQLVAYAQRDSVKTLPKLYTALLGGTTQSCEYVFRNYK